MSIRLGALSEQLIPYSIGDSSVYFLRLYIKPRIPLTDYIRLLEPVINKVYISPKFNDLFSYISLQCLSIMRNIDEHLIAKGVDVSSFLLDVYDLGEGEYTELKPYIEVRIRVSNVKHMIQIWKDTISFLEENFGNELLDYIDIFFTRD